MMRTMMPTRHTSDEAMVQYMLLRELQLKEQVEALARLPEFNVQSQPDDSIDLFDILDDELFPESPNPAPGSPARSESSMASSTNSAHIERDVPSPPRVVQGVVHVVHDGGETTTMTQALSTAYKYAVA